MTSNITCECVKGYYDDGENETCGDCGDILDYCLDCFYNISYDADDTGVLQYGCFEC